MQLLTAVMVLEREKLLAVSLSGIKIKILWTVFSHVQEQMFTNPHLKLPFPVDCLIPASTKAGVGYIQRAMALPSVEQEPTELTGAGTDCWGKSKRFLLGKVKINTYIKLSVFLLAVQTLPLCLPLSARKMLSISLKSGSELQVHGENTWLLCCYRCTSPARGIAQSVVPGFIWVPLKIALVRLKRGNLRVERLGCLDVWFPR